eukprot:CAMPEP_0117581462 /NCGR_PEP_ID=MMETSP0784-20121206/65840_1 /TAXON_ID=39447 /ORGANISM="" /LENGTH=81 /DNA_ID=CAMNT_0005381775 /DNA_START=215 /DNA_END=460 /DNA_ORIENTATION=-
MVPADEPLCGVATTQLYLPLEDALAAGVLRLSTKKWPQVEDLIVDNDPKVICLVMLGKLLHANAWPLRTPFIPVLSGNEAL